MIISLIFSRVKSLSLRSEEKIVKKVTFRTRSQFFL